MPGDVRHVAIGAIGVALALALSSCGSGSSESSTDTTERHPLPRIGLRAPTHRPVAGAPWPIAIFAYDRAGHPLQAEVRYRFLFAGSVVARRSHYRFRGAFDDTLSWPPRSIGVPLTFRAVVTTRFGIRRLDYDVRVKRGAR